MPELDSRWWEGALTESLPLRDALRRRDVGRVFQLLHRTGWSWSALARATGLTENQVRAAATGRRQVQTYDVLERVAVGLKIPRGAMGLGYGPDISQETTPPLSPAQGGALQAVAAPVATLASGALTSAADRSALAADNGTVRLLADTPSPLPEFDAVGHWTLTAPACQPLPEVDIEAHVYPGTDEGHIIAVLPPDVHHQRFFRSARRGLVVAAVPTATLGTTLFGLDVRHARRRLADGRSTRLPIPRAYALDPIVHGMLWALTSLDEALLDDDAALVHNLDRAAAYEPLTTSAVSRDLAPDLSGPGQMWLGSAFCANHILRHASHLTATPLFWSREQRGAEASSWLFFHHKYEYLKASVARFASNEPLVRIFCVPPEAVAASPTAERILLLLAVALMESFGIHAAICADAAYTAVEGFVLQPGSRAIVANWVNSAGIWHVDVTNRRPVLGEYADATSHVINRAVTAAPQPTGRLRALAEYLHLDWRIITTRCAELAEHGCDGVIQPRSRMLSTAGLNRACHFLAQPNDRRY